MPFGLYETTRRSERVRCWWSTRPRTQSASHPPCRPPALAMRPSGIGPSLTHPHSFFWAKAHLPQEPTEGGLAYRDPRDLLEEAAPVFEGEGGSILHVGFEELPGSVVELGFGAGMLLGGERFTFAASRGVAFYGGAAHPESSSSHALRHLPVHGLEDLLSEVFRVGFH